jgi:hypothetical protein
MKEVLIDDERLYLDAIKFKNVLLFLKYKFGDGNLVHNNVHTKRYYIELYHVFLIQCF